MLTNIVDVIVGLGVVTRPLVMTVQTCTNDRDKTQRTSLQLKYVGELRGMTASFSFKNMERPFSYEKKVRLFFEIKMEPCERVNFLNLVF